MRGPRAAVRVAGPARSAAGVAAPFLSGFPPRSDLIAGSGKGRRIMAEAVKIQVEVRDAGEEQGDRHPGLPQAPRSGPHPGDRLRAQAGPQPISIAPGLDLGDDQEVDPPGRAPDGRRRPRPSWSGTSSGTTSARRSSTSTSPASTPDESIETEVRLDLQRRGPGRRRGGRARTPGPRDHRRPAGPTRSPTPSRSTSAASTSARRSTSAS